MDSQSLKVQCQAALALRNLASDGQSQLVGPERDLALLITDARCVREIPTGDRQSRRS